MKKERGSYEEWVGQLQSTPLSLISWRDNKIMNLASTFTGSILKSKIKRFDRKTKTSIQVVRPYTIKQYNHHMGCLDLLDANLAGYGIVLRSRKWYIKLFYHVLDLTVVNSWLLWKRVDPDNKKNLADFKQDVAISLCKFGFKSSPSRGKPPVLTPTSTKPRG